MFAAILRRWKLVAPLALAILAIAVVSAGVLSAASAHGLKFHFFGRAVVLEDNSVVFPDWNCDTGNLDINGGSLDTGHCNAVFGGNTTASQNQVGIDASTVFAEATVKSDNTKHEGHVIATADAEGLLVTLTIPDDDADNPTDTLVILKSAQITATTEAECEQKNHHPHSSARSLTNVVFNDLLVAEGPIIDNDSDTPGNPGTILDHLTPSGAANESFPVFSQLPGFAEQLTVNEQHVFTDGGFSWIKADALHIIITNFAGTVVLDLKVDVTTAGIHCAAHLPSDDSIGA